MANTVMRRERLKEEMDMCEWLVLEGSGADGWEWSWSTLLYPPTMSSYVNVWPVGRVTDRLSCASKSAGPQLKAVRLRDIDSSRSCSASSSCSGERTQLSSIER